MIGPTVHRWEINYDDFKKSEHFFEEIRTKGREEVKKAMHEFKEGDLHVGKSEKKVTNPKQAVAIGLSKARKSGGKVPQKAS